MLVSKIKPCRS